MTRETATNDRASDVSMMLIALHLIGLLLDHGRHARTTLSSPPVVLIRAPLTIAIETSSAIPFSLANDALIEAAAIWEPLGVGLIWNASDSGERAPAVRVIFTDDVGSSSLAEQRLGWIRFWEPDAPEPIVHLSRPAALQLLMSTPSLREQPAKWHDVLIARALGRALAHELGHYLLASEAHTATGLMRANFPFEALIANQRVGFHLMQPLPADDREACGSTGALGQGPSVSSSTHDRNSATATRPSRRNGVN